jgi:plasmid stabilization system protein ParE
MKSTLLGLTPRARRDIESCVNFVGRFPRGKPEKRRSEIHAAFRGLCEFPERHPVERRRRRSGLELRRHQVSQFTIVYAYLRPIEQRPWGIVSIRAVQHRRVRDVFFGVRENSTAPAPTALCTATPGS